MYILENAIISITRNKGRNLLIGIIILVIAASISVTLAINNSAASLINSYENKYDVEVTLGINRGNMMGMFDPNKRDESKENMKDLFSDASNITVDDINLYVDSNYVKDYYYILTLGVNSNLEVVSLTSNNNTPDFGRFGGRGDFNMQGMNQADFSLKGYSSISSMNEFIDGTYTIISGSVSEDFNSNNCLINNELATSNSLEVGNTITIIDPNDSSKTYELVISGIYEEKSDNSSFQMFSNSANTIITNISVINKMKENNNDLTISTNPTFILTSKDVIDDFETELRSKGLNENLTVESNIDIIESSTSTISNVKSFAVSFLIITIIIGTTVLLVINMINIRERKYEIGVLRTIGMKKSLVSLQFITELLIVAIIFLFLGAGVGSIISVPVSNHLLQNEITSIKNEENKISANFGFDKGGPNGPMGMQNGRPNNKFKGVNKVEAFTSIDAVVDFKVLLELLGIGVVLTLVSSLSAITSIQKFSPLTILKERS